MDPVVPAYGGACVEGVLPSLLAGRPAPWMPTAAEGARQTVLLVLDGLGRHALDEHGALLPNLRSMDQATITTVAPSTTAAALTSITTGLPPAQHGIVGFRIRVGDAVLNVLRWHTPDQHQPPSPADVQRHAPFFGRDVLVVTKGEFRTTGFTEAHLRGARFRGWSTTAMLVEHVKRAVEAGERFVYAYYPGVDAVAHEFGLDGGYFTAELAFADALVGTLLDHLPDSCALVITSDHGQVQLAPDGWKDLAPIAPLVERCSGEGRFRYLHARPGATNELAQAAHAEFGHLAWILTRSELLDAGWLGPDPSPVTRRRIGDVVLAPHEPVGFLDPAMPREGMLVGAHASLTPDEMSVPLLAARGRA